MPAYPAPRPAAAAAPSTNTTQISPYLKEQMDRYRQRFSVDNTNRAIGRATTGAMDAAALAAADLKGNLSSRGLVGSEGGNAFLQKRVYGPAQRQAAGAAADIALGNENRLDALTLGGTGLMRAPDDIALANRNLNLQQSGQDFSQAMQQEQFRNQLQQQQYAQYLALLGM